MNLTLLMQRVQLIRCIQTHSTHRMGLQVCHAIPAIRPTHSTHPLIPSHQIQLDVMADLDGLD